MSLIISLRVKLSQVITELIDEIKKATYDFFLISTEELKILTFKFIFNKIRNNVKEPNNDIVILFIFGLGTSPSGIKSRFTTPYY